jgi:hypothetical protein
MATENIHTQYDWTSIPRNSPYRNVAPYVKLTSYKITSSAALNRINSYINLATAESADQFYEKLYQNVEKVDDFFIPYFGDGIRSFSNEFSDTFQNGVIGGLDSLLQTGANEVLAPMDEFNLKSNASQMMENSKKLGTITDKDSFKKAVGGMGKGLTSAPGSYIETPKLYQYAQNDGALEITFPLFNTINSDAVQKNYKLIDKLTRINRPKRLTSITMEPPHIYEVRLKGLRYMRWAYCSNFSVSMIGARRLVNGVITPDGYQITMSLTSLTTEVSNFMDKVNGPKSIVAVNTTLGQFTGNNIA